MPILIPNYSLAIRFGYLFLLYQSVSQNLSDMWRSIFEIDTTQCRRLRKSRQNHRSYVWIEAIFGVVFVPARDLSGMQWTVALWTPAVTDSPTDNIDNS